MKICIYEATDIFKWIFNNCLYFSCNIIADCTTDKLSQRFFIDEIFKK